MNQLSDYDKYLKYKNKYLNLKKQLGMRGGGDKTELVLVKAEWCGHCKNFLPVWNTLQNMDEFKTRYKFSTYDEKEDKDEIKNLEESGNIQVKGYPTLLINANNNVREYNGPKEMEHMLDLLNSLN